MGTLQFQEGVKVQRFCLTLVQEARLWYETLKPINEDWQGLQNQFRQQYSKIGNAREQFFMCGKSFHFDENTERLDSFVTFIAQVATLLGYGEPQMSPLFKPLKHHNNPHNKHDMYHSSIDHTLSQNVQENQKKLQRPHLLQKQMFVWTHFNFKKV